MTEDATYHVLSEMMSLYDAEGPNAPLKKGQEPFSWEKVSNLAKSCMDENPNITVGIWYIKAIIKVNTLDVLRQAVKKISELWLSREAADEVEQSVQRDELEQDAMILSWLGSADFYQVLPQVKINEQLRLSDWINGAAPEVSDSVVTMIKNLRMSMEDVQRRNEEISLGHLCALDVVIDQLRQIEGLGSNDVDRRGLSDVSVAGDRERIEVSSRERVVDLMDAIIKYYEKYEPSHPAPISLRKLKLMVGANFKEILSSLYSNGDQLASKIENPLT